MAAWLNDVLAGTSGLMPHGNCYRWVPTILWMQVISDSIIAIAYYSIPFALWYFVHKRKDLMYRWVFVLFGLFILLCGTTHLTSIWTIWYPDYVMEGILKSVTALVSIVTAVLVWPLIPKLLTLPSPKTLQTSETFIRAIFNATPDAMLISDEQGLITMVNRQAENLFGYPAEELLGKHLKILIPEHLQVVNVKLPDYLLGLSSGNIQGLERIVTALKKDQLEFSADINLNPIQTGQGIFCATSIRDVTTQKSVEAALLASEERFRRMAEVSPAMIWITNVNGKPTFVNQTWLNFTGLDICKAQTYSDWIKLIHPEDQDCAFKNYYKNIQDRKPIQTEYRMRRITGDWRWILDQGVPIFDEFGVFNGYIGSAIDITERKQTEVDFRIAATAFESQEAMVITDANTVILRVNKTFTDVTGYSVEELIGQKMNLFNSGKHDEHFYKQMWESINQTGSWQGEIWDKRKNGEIYPKWLTITAVKDANNIVTHYVGTQIDISERKAAEEEIKHLAFYDPLTKLPNRRLLRDRLQQNLALNARTGSYGALLFIDLDNFKILNDTWGHDKGDLLLQQVAERLTKNIRECDTVARLGGDEFVVILDCLSDKAAEAVVLSETIGEKILHSLNTPYQLADFEYRSTPSIGITLFNEKTTGIDELLKQADIAMYQAKAAGRNTLRFFDPSMQASVFARANLEMELHNALKQQQFILYYQPQVDNKGQILGAEALLRWQHPYRGILEPTEFIQLAEETGLILPLSKWVLETVCSQLTNWSSHPKAARLTMSVNIAVRQFRQTNFVEQILTTLQNFGVEPSKLKLELTEILLASEVDDVIGKMNALKAAGLKFSLDDFGTGYSSLSFLKQLPLDQLKIDHTFIKDMLDNFNDAVIAKMIIALAESMEISVIAEGVENQAQCDFLAEHGCLDYQGYLFSKPLSWAEFEVMLSESS